MKMNAIETNRKRAKKWNRVVVAVVLLLAAAGVTTRMLESKNVFASSGVTSEAAEITFASPTAAGVALSQAMASGDLAELTKVIGNDATALVTTHNAVSDQAAMHQFFNKYRQLNRWVAMSNGSQVLYIGADNFAFPVPLAKNATGSWYFDAVAGAQEIRARDIGRNELLAIDALGSIAVAQEIYREYNPSHTFAQRIVSTAGKQDGLYWPASDTSGISPIGYVNEFSAEPLASASTDQPFTVDGYHIRILTAQGADAHGGAKNYMQGGKLTGGFALLATPVKYGETGIMSFIVDRSGKIRESDLGPDTAKLSASITTYNPDENWSRIQ
jgi:Protein of unknown function (DUF2950)